MIEWKPLEIALLGLIAILGVMSQRRVFRQDCKRAQMPKRLIFPRRVSIIILAGYIVFAIAQLCDPKITDFTVIEALQLLVRAVIITLALHLKAYFGPVFVAYSLCGLVYNYFEHQIWHPWPMLEPLIDWLFGGMPKPIQYVYMIIAFVMALLASLADGLESGA